MTVTAAEANGITLSAFIDGVDAKGIRRQATIARHVPAHDLQHASVQVLGYYTEDPRSLPGTSSLGPSLIQVQELLDRGSKDDWSAPSLTA